MIVNRAKYISGIGAFIGAVLLVAGLYVCVKRIIFLANANALSGTIVSVSHEWVAAGRGSKLAYVPTVQITDSRGQRVNVRVDTFAEQPLYSIGQQLPVSCNPTRGCIENTFFAKWGDQLIIFLIALLFFSPLLAWKFGWWHPNTAPTRLRLQRDL
jgi:hypothetical protein